PPSKHSSPPPKHSSPPPNYSSPSPKHSSAPRNAPRCPPGHFVGHPETFFGTPRLSSALSPPAAPRPPPAPPPPHTPRPRPGTRASCLRATPPRSSSRWAAGTPSPPARRRP